MMGPGGGMWGPMRSFRRDPSVTKRKLPAGTLRRIAAFARPYRRAIVTLVSLLALDAAIGAVNPLIFRAIINQGILGHRSRLVFVLAITLGVMFTLSWQITLVALVLLPLFILPARRVGRRLQAITRESYNLNAAMTATMSERFNVAGALLTKLFGRPAEEDAGFADRAGRVRDIGVTSGMYNQVFFAAIMLVASLATAVVYGWGGWRAGPGA